MVDYCKHRGMYTGGVGGGGQIRLSFFLFCTARQHPEAPARTYGHMRGVSLKIVPANKVLFAGTVLANNLFVIGD